MRGRRAICLRVFESSYGMLGRTNHLGPQGLKFAFYVVCFAAFMGGAITGCAYDLSRTWSACIVTTPGKATCH
ncbi:hypothetical protein EMIT0158MI4_40076 [Burkholderia ambifaria]